MMDFDDALYALGNRFVVRRPSWPPHEVCIPYDQIVAVGQPPQRTWRSNHLFTTSDYAADDWQIEGSLQ